MYVKNRHNFYYTSKLVHFKTCEYICGSIVTTKMCTKRKTYTKRKLDVMVIGLRTGILMKKRWHTCLRYMSRVLEIQIRFGVKALCHPPQIIWYLRLYWNRQNVFMWTRSTSLSRIVAANAVDTICVSYASAAVPCHILYTFDINCILQRNLIRADHLAISETAVLSTLSKTAVVPIDIFPSGSTAPKVIETNRWITKLVVLKLWRYRTEIAGQHCSHSKHSAISGVVK